jgi:ubiquinone/menaquinone biosynthesis C-methylase UbiE
MMLALFNRRAKKTLDQVLRFLPLQDKTAVADLGCGGGLYALEFAQRVGPIGEVYAVDVNAAHLAYTRKKGHKAGLTERLTLVLAKEDDSLLPNASVDLVFSRNSYHHIKDPVGYFEKIRRALKPGGSVAIIDYDGSPGDGRRVSITRHRRGHSSNPEIIRRDMAAAGFVCSSRYDHLPGQSFQLFERPGARL